MCDYQQVLADEAARLLVLSEKQANADGAARNLDGAPVNMRHAHAPAHAQGVLARHEREQERVADG